MMLFPGNSPGFVPYPQGSISCQPGCSFHLGNREWELVDVGCSRVALVNKSWVDGRLFLSGKGFGGV